MPEISVGIDLGTTNSCAYYYINNSYECVTHKGSRLFPSFVEYDKDKITIGKQAKLHFGKSNNVVRNMKRIIGRFYDSKEVTESLDYCGVPVVAKNNKPYFRIASRNTDYSPSDVCAEILKEIKKAIQEQTECTIGDVVVTIPANYNNNQRQATRDAIATAGFNMNRVKLLNEPSAAAICYGLAQTCGDSKILVYDLGGGTFDVSILDISDGNYRVVLHDGDNFLGGSNFDELIFDWLTREVMEKYGEELIPEDLPEDEKRRSRSGLLRLCEEAKEQLSSMTEVDIEPLIFLEEGYSFSLDIGTLNKLIVGLIDKSINIVKRAINNAGLTVNDISRVVLVGGSTRLLLVKEKVKALFGDKISQSINPDECVAMGACMALVNKILPKEKTSFCLGTSLINNQAECIIPANEDIPCSQTVVLTTAVDFASTIYTQLCQGKSTVVEEVESLDNYTILKPYSFSGFQIKPKGEVHFQTTFSYDGENKVHVHVVEKETGKELFSSELTWDF